MQKFICSFGMGSLLAGKFLVVGAHDINHCSDILRDGVMLDAAFGQARGAPIFESFKAGFDDDLSQEMPN